MVPFFETVYSEIATNRVCDLKSLYVIKPPLAIANCSFTRWTCHLFAERLACKVLQKERFINPLTFCLLSFCPSVCLSPKCVHKNAIFSKAQQFRAMVSIDNLQEVLLGLFKEPIIEPLKFKMAEISHLEGRQIFVSQRKIIRFYITFGTG